MTRPEHVRVNVLYSGHVQGVGFRYTVLRESSRRDVAGTVRNLGDGRVELVAEGGRAAVEGFLDAIASGALRAYITGSQATWSAATGEFDGFSIRW